MIYSQNVGANIYMLHFGLIWCIFGYIAISKGFVIPYDSSFNAIKVTQKDTCISHMPAHTYTPHPKLNNT